MSKKWYNNGYIEILCSSDCVPESFKKGRLQGRRWFNNGVVESYTTECPEGFVSGRLPLNEATKQKMSQNSYIKKAPAEYKHNRAIKGWDTRRKWEKDRWEEYIETLSISCSKALRKSPWNKGKVGVQKAWNKGLKLILSPESVENMKRKQYETKKKNNSFHISKQEDLMYLELCNHYGADDVVRQYSDERYPFACDFYIKSQDLFIEFNRTWTHGGKPFNSSDPECINKLSIWREKARTSKYYQTAIYVWTKLDVIKLNTFITNNLNYKIIY